MKFTYVQILIIILSLYLTDSKVFAQTNNDIEQFANLFDKKRQKKNFQAYFKDNTNEIKQISSALFIFYKEFFSSQDGNHCVFYPSCSVYTINAIKKQGLAVGIINGVDRLSRCNRLSPENYNLYKNTKLFYDPLY